MDCPENLKAVLRPVDLQTRARTLLSATAALANYARRLEVVDDPAVVDNPVSINVPGQWP